LRPADLTLLVLLGAIWGGAFPLLKVATPQFGPIALIFVRVLTAAIVLLPLVRERELLRTQWRPLLLLGLINTAIPFVLFSFATLSITAGLASLLNSTTPMFGALVARVWLGERLTFGRMFGIVLGFVGVGLLVGDSVGVRGSGPIVGVLAGLTAAALYGVAANLSKRWLAQAQPATVAAGTVLGATVALAPLALFAWPAAVPSSEAWASAVALGVLCTAIAYLIYFRLLERVAVSSAVAVTFLIPMFGIVWGALFLGERITPQLLGGCAVVLLGTALATGILRLPQSR
jgi:drug/metabolite transporter (DMT)-like permease